MSVPTWYAGWGSAGVHTGTGSCTYPGGTPYRMLLLGASIGGATPSINNPAAGGMVDGITQPTGRVLFACPGWFCVVEAGGSFGTGDLLQTDAIGRAQLRTTGAIVMRALEGASGAGELVQAVFAR